MTQVKTFPKIQDLKINQNNSNDTYRHVEEYKTILKNHPSLLNEPLFVITNIQYSSLDLAQYPQHIRENPLFLQAYFSHKKEANPKEFAKITPDLLKNSFFINSAVVKNPDIYLLADPSAVNDYTMGIIQYYHPDKVLKYSASEDLANFDYCLKHIKTNSNNFEFLSDEFKHNESIINIVFNDKSSARNQPLVKFLTKDQKNNKEFIEKLTLQYNLGCFPFLPKSYHNDPEFCTKVLKDKSIYFKYVSNELKNNKDWVNHILKYPEYTNDLQGHAFKKYEILSQLSLDYFTEDFCNEHSTTLNKGFTYLSKEQLALPLVVKHAFRAESLYNNMYSSTQLEFFNHIQNVGLKHAMKELFKPYKQTYKYEFYESQNDQAQRKFAREAENLAANYFLYEKLEKNLAHKTEQDIKKKKI